MEMEQTCMWVVEYVWLDAESQFRSKVRVFERKDDISSGKLIRATNISREEWTSGQHDWNYDGSSTGQAETKSSDVLLKPIAVYPHPLLKASYMESLTHTHTYTNPPYQFRLLFCHSVLPDGTPAPGCNYEVAKVAFEKPGVREMEYWFGIEQEYFFQLPGEEYPVGFLKKNHQWKYPEGSIYYCGIGADAQQSIFRKIATRHLAICGEMGIPMSGINAEVVYGQWEYQVGPSVGIQAAFDLWVSRLILVKIAEENGYQINFHPKPLHHYGVENGEGGERVTPTFNGSGCHINISTKRTREEGGFTEILFMLPILGARHTEFLKVCGKGNDLRLNGKCETSDPNIFTWSVGGRDTSIRIGHVTEREQKGYFEDRRPGANIDPFLVLPYYIIQ